MNAWDDDEWIINELLSCYHQDDFEYVVVLSQFY